jgi:hypothetical protein
VAAGAADARGGAYAPGAAEPPDDAFGVARLVVTLAAATGIALVVPPPPPPPHPVDTAAVESTKANVSAL